MGEANAPRTDAPRERPRRTPPLRLLRRPNLRLFAIVAFATLLGFATYGTLVPATPRCSLPGAVGCPGGVFGPALAPLVTQTEWFDVTMYDWGVWILYPTTGANVSGAWTIFEGYTININATSLPPDTAVGGTAYHGLGVEVNATGQQLLSLSAPVGKWVTASFVAPSSAYYHQHIWCTIECGPGHSSQQEHNLNIVPAVALPTAAVVANTTTGAIPLSVGFSGAGASGTPPYNLTWNFGDGSSAAFGANVTHVYTLGGIYDATLTVTDAKGNQGSATATITALSGAGLNASLTASPDSGVAPVGPSFSVVAHGGTPPYQYDWAFGDGSGGLGANLTRHVYTAPGVYAAFVNVTDSAGAHARAIASVVVHPPTGALTVAVTASPSNGSAPFLTTLGATVSGGTAPYTLSWLFGDGGAGTGLSTSHSYNQTGEYVAVAFATDAAGAAGTGARTLDVKAGGGGGGGNDTAATSAASALTVLPFLAPSGGGAPLATLAVASVENGSGRNLSVAWNFGDGTTGTGLVVLHTFAAPGTYAVTATARDSTAGTGVGTTSVVVGRPSISIVLNATSGDTPLAIDAAVTLTGGSGDWSPAAWQWGDGSSGAGFRLSHLFPLNLSGDQPVQASATDAAGHIVNATALVRLTGPPVANLSVAIPGGNALPALVNFTLNVTGGTGGYPSQVLWAFGDQTSTRGPTVESHAYNRTGHFHVVVETNDSAGRVAIASAWVNLSSAVPLPPLSGGGGGGWVLTGVAHPGDAALLLIGMVGATGLGFLVRKRRRAPPAGRTAPVSTPARLPPAPKSTQVRR